MLTKAVEQFLRDVHWGPLDYLLIDMPPGTGDVQMGLARLLPRTDLIIVTTPVSAQKVAIRAADMARRSFLRVAGVIENMSSFTCEHGDRCALFGEGGGRALADEVGVELLGQVPIESAVSAGGDAGGPVVLGDRACGRRSPRRDHRPETVPPVAMAGCSTCLLDAVEAALRTGCGAGGRRGVGLVSQGRPSSSGSASKPSSGAGPPRCGPRRLAAASAGSLVGGRSPEGDSASSAVPYGRISSRFLVVGAIMASSPRSACASVDRPYPQAGDGLVVVVQGLLRLQRVRRRTACRTAVVRRWA